ncbi:MAG: VWA domain-containing protein [Acidobacteriota bacterium]
MRFLRPDMLEWLLVLPALVACWLIQNHYLGRVSRQSPVATRFLGLSRRSRRRTRVAVLAAALACAGAMVFALARPQVVVAARVPEFERQDLVVILDRSASMWARDIEPSRLTRATAEIRHFLRNRPAAIDRVALVGFADSALVLSYPTADAGSLFFYLDWIDGETTPLYGTNMGRALIKALDVVRLDRRKTRKLFLLISDGEDLGAELGTALARFRASRHQVHCIGVGSAGVPPIPLPGVDGRESWLLDDDDRPMRTRFTEATLRRIADGTGGRYLRSSSGTEMARAINAVVRGEQRVVGWKSTTDYRDVYGAGLIAALVAGAVLWLLW